MVLKFKLVVARQSEELYRLMEEVRRLSKKNADFFLGCNCKGASKIYIESCKGRQKTQYVSVANIRFSLPIIATINFAIAQHSDISIELSNNTELYFTISGADIGRVKDFADAIEVKYEICR